MTRTQTACYALIASAFVLAAMLAAAVSQRHDPAAHAEMVVNKNVFTILTAAGFQENEEFIYLLDNKNERLLCYIHDPRGRIELFGSMNVTQEIQRGLSAIEKGAGGRRNR